MTVWVLPSGTGQAAQTCRLVIPSAPIDLQFAEQHPWPHRIFGGSGIFHMVPGLNQYWHPWLLGGRATGRVELDGEVWEFLDADVYGEKNWGKEGFPESWWWGQASGFAEREACVAFAGGVSSRRAGFEPRLQRSSFGCPMVVSCGLETRSCRPCARRLATTHTRVSAS